MALRILFFLCCIILPTSLAQVFRFSQDNYEVSESGFNVLVTIERGGDLEVAATVGLDTSLGIGLPATIPFAIDQTSQILDLSLIGFENNIEDTCRLETLTLTQPSSGSIGIPDSTTVIITDDDGAVTTWTSWGDFTTCSVSCGGGISTRTRSCSATGLTTEQQECNTDVCPTEWNSWGEFTTCSVSCGGGTSTRTRTCSASVCTPGSATDDQPCNTDLCLTVPTWSSWGFFDTCSRTCGGGTRTRTRTCSDSTNVCTPGSSMDTQQCNTESCTSEFSFERSSYEASKSVGSITIFVLRDGPTLVEPVTLQIATTAGIFLPVSELTFSGGLQSFQINLLFLDDGQNQDFVATLTISNPSNGVVVNPSTTVTFTGDGDGGVNWNQWLAWGACSAGACGSGVRIRTRTCADPQNTCVGSATDNGDCSSGQPCGVWGLWGEYGRCSQDCGGGTQERTRICTPVSAVCTPGLPTGSRSCNTATICPEWSSWANTGECTVTCGGGTQPSERTCNDPNPDDGLTCIDSSTGQTSCNEAICPDTCGRDVERTPYATISAPGGAQTGTVYVCSELCPWYTRNANTPIASATCERGSDGIVSWVWEIRCGGNKTKQEILTEIGNMPITEDNAGWVLQSTSELTSAAGDIEAQDVCNVIDVLDDVAALQIPDVQVTDAFVKTVSNLFDVNTNVLDEAGDMNCPSADAIQMLEKQLDMVEIFRGDIPWPYRMVTDNVAAEVFFNTKEELYEGIYAASSDASDTVGGSSNTVLTLERGRKMDVEIEIPPAIAHEFPSGARVAISAFENNRLLRSSRLMSKNSQEPGFNTVTNSRVISATVGGKEVNGLPEPIRIQYRPLQKGNNSKCVFWEFQSGDWVTDGCTFIGMTPDGTVKCECNHLTNFAILMDIYGGTKLTPTQDYILEILSYVGCCLSIVGLIVTLITYGSYRKLRIKKPNQILMSLCAALLGLYIVFVILLSIDTERNKTEIEKTGCSILAGVLHYFTLASIFWMTVEAYNMYLMFVKVINSYVPKLLLKASIFAWGGPLIVVAITAGVARTDYARSDFCFLQKWPLIGGVLIPIGLLLVFNIVVFVLVMIKLSRDSPAGKMQVKRKSLRVKRLRNAAMIMTLMGLTWAIGYLSIIQATTFFSQLLFCLFNAMQGYVIFMMYCVQQATVRNYWRGLCGTVRKGSRPSVSSSRLAGRSSREEFISSNRRSSSTAALVSDTAN